MKYTHIYSVFKWISSGGKLKVVVRAEKKHTNIERKSERGREAQKLKESRGVKLYGAQWG